VRRVRVQTFYTPTAEERRERVKKEERREREKETKKAGNKGRRTQTMKERGGKKVPTLRIPL